jgi:hypothetical protein
MRRINPDMWIGFSTIGIAALGWFVIIPLGVDVPQSVKILALSPDFWPRIVIIMLAACGGVTAFQGCMSARGNGDGGQAALDEYANSDDDTVSYSQRTQLLRVAGALAGLFVFYLIMPYVGMVVGSILLVLISTRILGVQSWFRSASLAVLLPVLLYYFFAYVAQIPIPLGVFEALR